MSQAIEPPACPLCGRNDRVEALRHIDRTPAGGQLSADPHWYCNHCIGGLEYLAGVAEWERQRAAKAAPSPEAPAKTRRKQPPRGPVSP